MLLANAVFVSTLQTWLLWDSGGEMLLHKAQHSLLQLHLLAATLKQGYSHTSRDKGLQSEDKQQGRRERKDRKCKHSKKW